MDEHGRPPGATPYAAPAPAQWWAPPAEEPRPPRPPRRRRRGLAPSALVGALLLGMLGGLVGGLGALRLADVDTPEVVEASPVGSAGSAGAAAPVTAIARAALPSVVFISVGAADDAGVGSGFVIREDGYIVTNSHVIEAAADGTGTITVDFADDREAEAEIVGRDAQYDIAVLKVDLGGLQALEFGDSDAIEVGMPVVAVGAPLGLDSTVTSGIVSARDRPVSAGNPASPSFINAIQTDAAINPGNSGGPLLDGAGRVIGVNSAIAQLPDAFVGGPGGSIGLGFAIPSNQASHTATQLIETGSSQYPVIGVILDLSYTGEGAQVLEEASDGSPTVVPDGPADRAGIEPGDRILAVDGQRIESSQQLIVVLRSHQVGEDIEVVVAADADGGRRTVTVTLAGSAE